MALISPQSITGLLQEFDVQEQDIETLHGSLHVTLCGTPKGNRPVILTYHDIGMNREFGELEYLGRAGGS